ncbi:MAG: hypothetical protein E7645_03965 [Ruminococcaceae bacterium]|nr:hypothetical protein [Oscillospiraceae bacterium]
MKKHKKRYLSEGPLMAVDALGRPTPDTTTGAPSTRDNRLVGMFYFLWLGEHGRHKPYDISKLTAADPNLGYKPASPLWGGHGVYHHWGEPFYGYYYSNDEWVVRRHMKLLMQADIDFLFFDTTNAAIYRDNAKLVMRVLQEYHDEGWKIPQVMFYTNTSSGLTVLDIYDSIYKPGWCKDTWFCLDGKPVIIAVKEECTPECREFFNIKMSQWPNEPDKLGGWPWMDFTHPQRVFANLDGVDEVINVSVAQHSGNIRFGDSVLYGETSNCGRAYHNGQNDPDPDAWKKGYNFAEQFDRALETDPPIVLITGWNEWIAGYWAGIPSRPVMFVDAANYEYSRDLEMMRGGYFDNYFMQLVGYVRRYKGTTETPVYEAVDTVDVPWRDAFDESPAVYKGFLDGDFTRHAEGQGGVIYANFTQRNVMDTIAVMHDKENICFTIRTKDMISDPLGAGSWMKLYLNTEGGMGYQYVLNHSTRKNGTTTLAFVKEAGEELAAVDVPSLVINYEVRGDVMQIKVPRKAIGLDHNDFTLWFKVADSREEYTKIEDFYDKGDVAPLGRLNFVYRGE